LMASLYPAPPPPPPRHPPLSTRREPSDGRVFPRFPLCLVQFHTVGHADVRRGARSTILAGQSGAPPMIHFPRQRFSRSTRALAGQATTATEHFIPFGPFLTRSDLLPGAGRVRQVRRWDAGQVGVQKGREPGPGDQDPDQAPPGAAARREGHQGLEAGHGPPHAAGQKQAGHDGLAADRGTSIFLPLPPAPYYFETQRTHL